MYNMLSAAQLSEFTPQERAELKNCIEYWPLIDTVLIGSLARNYDQSYYQLFTQLANESHIPFFSLRNRSSVGSAYNNFDNADQMAFSYLIESVGVEWYCPVLSETTGAVPANNANMQMFMDCLNHSSFRLQVGLDEKLLVNTTNVPGGTGVSGTAVATNATIPESIESYQLLSNGAPELQNRYVFAEPIAVPRSRNILASIDFSNYAKNLLKQMPGPYDIALSSTSSISSMYMIRVSMTGYRSVQKRGELRY